MSISVQIVCDNCGANVIQNEVGVVTAIGTSVITNINRVSTEYRDSNHYCSPACMVKVYSKQVSEDWQREKGIVNV
jgi:hypothetical protein